MALPDCVLVAESSNGSWQAERTLTSTVPQCLAVDPASPERAWCGTFGQGLFVTEDAGRSWRNVGFDQVTAVALDRDAVYAGCEPSSLHRSDDGGSTWRECSAMRKLPSAPTWSFPPRPHTSHVRWITPDPVVDGRLFVCIEAGALLRSLDGGRTWEDRRDEGPFDTHTLLAHPSVPGLLYSAAGDGVMAHGRGFSVSKDAAQTWDRPDEGLDFNYLWGAAVDPADAAAVVVSGSRGPQQAHAPQGAESLIYRRRTNGSWEESREGLPEPAGTNAWVLAAGPSESGAFYAASNRGIYRSIDGAESWEQLPVPGMRGRANALVVCAA